MLDALAPTWLLALTFVPAVALAAAAVAVGRCDTATGQWRAARAATAVAAIAAAAMVVARVWAGSGADELVRLDSVTAVMSCLIAFVGWVVVRFSPNYLAGDPHEKQYAQRMLAKLAAVSLVVVANHFVLLVAAWTAASVAMHGLLTFFGDRPVAVSVAHKKFLLARCADAAMLGAVVTLGLTFETLRIDVIVDTAAGAATLPTGARVGVTLIAVAALLKCAQLPFHGWLIQVMEAPTPVSALLHAGVVNLGGFVLLRFAPLVDRSVETRTLLVVVGTFTAVIASLVMTTRVSVKVALAWSTCAQMGFMLMQCGLGVWEMALLHLVAHSLYKAHAFLSAGGTVRHTQRRQLAARPQAPSLRVLAFGTTAALAGAAFVGFAWQALPATKTLSPAVWVLVWIVALAIVPLTTPTGHGRLVSSLAGALGVPLVYLALHEMVARLVPQGSAAPAGLLVFVSLGFLALFIVRSASSARPAGWLARRVRPWVYAGLFLDEGFTRFAFAVSPPPRPRPRPAALSRPRAVAVVRAAAPPTAARPTVAAAISSTTPGTKAS